MKVLSPYLCGFKKKNTGVLTNTEAVFQLPWRLEERDPLLLPWVVRCCNECVTHIVHISHAHHTSVSRWCRQHCHRIYSTGWNLCLFSIPIPNNIYLHFIYVHLQLHAGFGTVCVDIVGALVLICVDSVFCSFIKITSVSLLM